MKIIEQGIKNEKVNITANSSLFFIQKIVLLGPESTGKTTLAKALATHFQTIWVEEYARTYIEQLNRSYEKADLLTIAKGQIEAEMEALPKANQFLFCDTDLRVIKVWSEFKYQDCDTWILEQIEYRDYKLYLLCGIDAPWEYDPQREHPHLRAELYEIYKQQLEKDGVPFLEVWGSLEERVNLVVEYLSKHHFLK